MSVEPFKYLIQPVAIERDDERIVRELPGQVLTVYSVEQAVEAINEFEEQLEKLVAESNGKVAVGD